ncbi:hypothetical protein CDL12_19503 [Olea europaea subsp. europaea]|uniref:Uncharacterized protein n=1 Tax=Olea europaea subsp. europaea TaxID=158383 RepID=A0A8S0SIW5_OLEEU|nr:hypothetical protein CDL12_19503 [Olea europaea subsp. europaea]
MAKGPSPIIPLLLAVSLGLLLKGNFQVNLPTISEAENAIFTFVVFIPFLVLLTIYSTSTNHAIVVPIALILIMYTVTTMLLGPLVLILIVYIANSCSGFLKSGGEELGWGFMLVLVFFVLNWVVSDAGRQWGVLVLAILIYVLYHFVDKS